VSLGGLLLVGYALVLGSYHFIVVVCLVPAVTYAGARALWRKDFRGLGRWALVVLVPLALASLLYWERVLGCTSASCCSAGSISAGAFLRSPPGLARRGREPVVGGPRALGAPRPQCRIRRPRRLGAVAQAAAPAIVAPADHFTHGADPDRIWLSEWRGYTKGTTRVTTHISSSRFFIRACSASFALWLRPLSESIPWRARLPAAALAAVMVPAISSPIPACGRA